MPTYTRNCDDLLDKLVELDPNLANAFFHSRCKINVYYIDTNHDLEVEALIIFLEESITEKATYNRILILTPELLKL